MLSFSEYRKQKLQKSFGSNVFENIDKKFSILKTDLFEACSAQPLTESYDYRANYILDRILEEDRRWTNIVVETYIEHFRENVHAYVLENISSTVSKNGLQQAIRGAVQKFIGKIKQTVTAELAKGHAPAGAAGVAADDKPAQVPASAQPQPTGQAQGQMPQAPAPGGPAQGPMQPGQPQAGPGMQGQMQQGPAGQQAAPQSGGSWFSRKSTHPLMKWANVPKSALKWLRGAYRGDYLDDHTIQKLATIVETIFHENDMNVLAMLDQFGAELEKEIMTHVDTYMQQNPSAGTPPPAPPTAPVPPTSDVGATPPEAAVSMRGAPPMTADRYSKNIEKIKKGAWVHPSQLFSMIKQDFEKGNPNANTSASYLDKMNYYRDQMKLPRLEKSPVRPSRDPAEIDAEIGQLKGKTPDELKRFFDKNATTGAGRKRLRDIATVMGLELPKRGADVRDYLSKAEEIMAKLGEYQPKPADQTAAPAAPENSRDVANMLGTSGAEPASVAAMSGGETPEAPSSPEAPAAKPDYMSVAQRYMGNPTVQEPRPMNNSDKPNEEPVTIPHLGRNPDEPAVSPQDRQRDEPIPTPERTIDDIDSETENEPESPAGPTSIEVKSQRVKDRVAELAPQLAMKVDINPNVDKVIQSHADKSDDEIANILISILKGNKPAAPEAAPAAAPDAPMSWDDKQSMLSKLNAPHVDKNLLLKRLDAMQSQGMQPEQAVERLSSILGAKPKPAPVAVEPEEAPAPEEAKPVAPVMPARPKNTVHWHDDEGINNLMQDHLSLDLFDPKEQARMRQELERIRDIDPQATPDQAVRTLAQKFAPLIDKKRANKDRYDAMNNADAGYENSLRTTLGDRPSNDDPEAPTAVDDEEGEEVPVDDKDILATAGKLKNDDEDDGLDDEEAVRTRSHAFKGESVSEMMETFRQRLALRLG